MNLDKMGEITGNNTLLERVGQLTKRLNNDDTLGEMWKKARTFQSEYPEVLKYNAWHILVGGTSVREAKEGDTPDGKIEKFLSEYQ